MQLPGKEDPTTLWPETKWKDIGSEYSGLFFRVEGGEAAAFGTLQEDNTRRLKQVYYGYISANEGDPEIPKDGSWSRYATSGKIEYPFYGLSFRLTTGEVRPRNKAVKVWQRIK